MDVKLEHQGLSADEIALLEGDELEADGTPKEDEQDRQRAAAASPGGAADSQESDDDDADEQPPSVTAPPASTAAAAPPAVGDTAAPAATPAAATAPPAPAPAGTPAPAAARYQVDPAKIETELAALDAKHNDAFAKLMDGEIDQTEYRKVQDEVRKAERGLVAQQALHEANVQAERAEQQAVITRVAEQGAKDGIDYRTDAKAQRQFDMALTIAAEDKDNAGKSFADLAAEAHRAVLAMRGKTPAAAPTAPPAAPAAPPAQASLSRSVDKSQLPPTLSRVPPAADPSIAGDEFAHLASLEGVELEKAFAKMTPEQQERYLN